MKNQRTIGRSAAGLSIVMLWGTGLLCAVSSPARAETAEAVKAGQENLLAPQFSESVTKIKSTWRAERSAHCPRKPGPKERAELDAELIEEVKRGNIEDIRRLLDSGAEAWAKTSEGTTALMYAAMYGDAAITRLLMDRGASVDTQDDQGDRALALAAKRGAVDVAKVLLRSANPNLEGSKGTPLLLAAENGDKEMTELLLSHKAVPDPKDGGDTPLIEATSHGFPQVMAILLRHGADPDLANGDGNTPLFYVGNDKARIDVLLGSRGSRRPNVNHRNNAGQTPLIAAAVEGGQPEAPRALIARGAVVDAKDNDGATALLAAASKGSAAMVKALLDAGADPAVKDNAGRTALIRAVSSARPEAFAVLLAYSDVNAKDSQGGDALWYAIANDQPDLVRQLIYNGANKNAVWKVPLLDSTQDYNALMVAASYCAPGAAKVLIDLGVDLNFRNSQGMTPLSVAEAGGYCRSYKFRDKRCEELFRSKGAK